MHNSGTVLRIVMLCCATVLETQGRHCHVGNSSNGAGNSACVTCYNGVQVRDPEAIKQALEDPQHPIFPFWQHVAMLRAQLPPVQAPASPPHQPDQAATRVSSPQSTEHGHAALSSAHQVAMRQQPAGGQAVGNAGSSAAQAPDPAAQEGTAEHHAGGQSSHSNTPGASEPTAQLHDHVRFMRWRDCLLASKCKLLHMSHCAAAPIANLGCCCRRLIAAM